MTSRLVVLISGNGSNLQAILDACASGELPASVVTVISNKAEAYGLIRATNAGVESIHFAKQANESRQQYDSRLADFVTTKQPDYIILAGWMRILSSSFLSSFPNRVINLHPALPETFPGTHAIERAYQAYQRGEINHTGVMVHLVPDEGVDNGPVLATEIIPIHPDDTLESLETRIHDTEHKLLVETVKKMLNPNPTTLLNLTLDTSCIIPLLHLPDDFTDKNEIEALEKIQKTSKNGKLKLWVSKKSVNESLKNLETSETDNNKNQKWLKTLSLLDDYDNTASVAVWGISRWGYDTVFASDEQSDDFEKIKKIIKGNKSKLAEGDVYDMAILYEHYLHKNDLFLSLDKQIFRQTVIEKLHKEFKIRVVTSPSNALSILESEYKIDFN